MKTKTLARLVAMGLLFVLVLPCAAPGQPDEPLPQGPKVRLGTTLYRNVSMDRAYLAFTLSPDARMLAVMTGSRELAFMDATNGKVSRRVQLDTFGGGRVDYLPGGKLMKVESHDGVSIIDAETGRSVSGVRFENTYYRSEPAVAADGSRVAVAKNMPVPPREERKPIPVVIKDVEGNKADRTVTTIQNDLVRASLSADGKVLATWGRYQATTRTKDGFLVRDGKDAQEYTVQIWDADTGTERCQLVLGHTGFYGFDPEGFTLTATVSPNGKEVAVAVVQAGGVECFDTASGKSVRHFVSRGAPVKRLTYSPDGIHLAALGFDGAVQLWDLKTEARVGVVESPVGEVAGVVFPEPGRAVAWGMDGSAVVLWEIPSGKQLHVPVGHTSAITSIVFSSNGKTILTAGADHIVAEWHAASGTLLSSARLKIPERARPERKKAGGTPGWGVPDVTTLSPDGKRVAVATNGNTLNELLVFDRAKGTELLGMKSGFPTISRWYLAPAFSPDGARIFYPPTGLSTRDTKAATAPVWDIDSGRQVCGIPLAAWASFQPPFAFSPNGTRIVRLAVDRDSTNQKWSLSLNSWDSKTGEKLAERHITSDSGAATAANYLAVGPDNRTALVAIGSIADAETHLLFTWDYTTGKVIKDLPNPDSFAIAGPLAISPDGKLFVAVGHQRKKYGERTLIRVCDLATGEVRRELIGSAEHVTAIAFSPDGKTLATGSQDTTVLLWDLSVIGK